MAYFAELDDNNIVVRVAKVPKEQEARGNEYLSDDLGLGGRWEQTSYNSRGGVHYLPNSNTPSGQPHFRYNYAGQGYTFDPDAGTDGAFIPPKESDDAEWTLDTDTYLWTCVGPDEGE